MKGLLSKDFSNSSSFLIITSFISLFLAVFTLLFFSLTQNLLNGFLFSIYFGILTLILAVNTFQRDEASKWNSFAFTLPINRNVLVQSKYVFLGLFLAIYYVLSLFFAVIFQYFTLPFLWGHLVTLSITLIFLSVFLPFVYQWGIFRAFASPVLLYLFFQLVLHNYSGSLTTIETHYPGYVYVIACAIALLLYGFSCRLSCRILENKDIVFSTPSHSLLQKDGFFFLKPRSSIMEGKDTNTNERMKPFWHKEFLSLRSTIISNLVFAILYTILFINVVASGEFLTIGTGPLNLWIFILMMMLPYQSFRNDESTKWNLWIHSFPTPKNQLVKIKYLFLAAFLILGILCSFLASLIFYHLVQSTLWFYTATLGVGLIFISIFIPLAYSRGSQASLFLVVIAYITLMLSAVCTIKYWEPFTDFLLENKGYSTVASLIFLLFAISAYLLSYRVSCKMIEVSEVR